MARPREHEEHSRVHMGTRFDKDIIHAFDKLCYEHHLSRTQALECLVSNALTTGHIPQFVKGVLSKVKDPATQSTQAILRGPGKRREPRQLVRNQTT